jgi:Mg2+ and Co2+ transporter CorA
VGAQCSIFVFRFRFDRFITFSEAHYVPGSNILNDIDLYMIILDDVVLTFHHGPIQAVQLVVGTQQKQNKTQQTSKISFPWVFAYALFFSCVERLKNRKFEPRASADWIMYALLDAITSMFFHLVEQLVMEVRALDELVLLFSAGEQSDLLRYVSYLVRLPEHVSPFTFFDIS